MLFGQNGCVPNMFLNAVRMPFAEKDRKFIYVSEGALYSPEEVSIHGITDHKHCVDLAAPYGTPIYAPWEGIAYATIQLDRIECPDGKIRGYGGGLNAELCRADGLRIQFLHLKEINEQAIPLAPPIKRRKSGRWDPYKETKSGRFVLPEGVMIPQGTLIGYVGRSGLADVGHFETPDNLGQVKSWDEPHAHIWLGYRGPNGKKIVSFDPFWRYDGNLKAYNKALRGKGHDMWERTPGAPGDADSRQIIWF